MKHRHTISVSVICATVLCLGGCGSFRWKATSLSVTEAVPAPAEIAAVNGQERDFAGALEFLRSGKEQEARDLLERVVAAPPVGGVTDEALFRMSLLYLRDDGRGTARSLELLNRLAAEYPGSIWTHQSESLAAYLSGVKTLRDRQREIKTLRDLNLSLSRDNREMRQSLERLKNLDLELEKKIKR